MIASAELVSFLYMLIILVSLLRNTDKSSRSNRLYIAFTAFTAAGLLADAFSYILDGSPSSGGVLTIINILAFSLINVVITLFVFYLISFIRKKREVSYRAVIPVVLISASNILLVILGAIGGQFFSVKNGRLVYGPWDFFLSIMPLFSVIVVPIIMIFYLKYLEKRDAAALGSFVVFPLIAAVILSFDSDLQFGYLATSLSCAVIFTFIKREAITESHHREMIEKHLSTRDALTGLLNRRGYYEALEKMSEHDSLGVVFCDLNALKYTNDNFGHVAGDAYIKRFADILLKIFGDACPICRIGGDEFVVLLYDMQKDRYEELKAKLNLTIRENGRIASAGYAYADNKPTMDLIKCAEKEMYVDKGRYYKETGQDRRRQA